MSDAYSCMQVYTACVAVSKSVGLCLTASVYVTGCEYTVDACMLIKLNLFGKLRSGSHGQEREQITYWCHCSLC